MFPIRLVFVIAGISMILSSAVIGGESRNDRIDTLLSVVYSMRDRMDSLVKDVGNIETKVNNIDTMEEITAEKVSKLEDEMVGVRSDMSSVKSQISSMSSKINEVEKKVSSTNSKVSTIESAVWMSTADKVKKSLYDLFTLFLNVCWTLHE